MTNLKLSTYLSEEQIQKKVKELGEILTKKFKGQEVVAVCVLKGSFVFYSDLIRNINTDISCEFFGVSSYHGSTSSSGEVKVTLDLAHPVEGKHVLLVEDIVDTGRSAEFLLHVLEKRGAASLKMCAFIDKRERREVEVSVDFAGFPIQKGFIVGYGMDYAEKYRELDAVYELVPE